MPIEHEKILSKLTEIRSTVDSEKHALKIEKPNKGDYLGQKYREGDLIRDKESGDTGEVVVSYTKRVISV